jgi:glucose/arabinose dehydrogenase/lysophospholipase L1-like esterase
MPWKTILPALATLLVAGPGLRASAAALELRPGEHVCIIGNTLAERMQHDGWLETLLHERFPEHRLVIRNLGFSGDELKLRLRSKNFGTPDQWLAGKAPPPEGFSENPFGHTNTQADVILAFFGYNESFGGEEGLDQFKQDLADVLQGMLEQKYNGQSPPRIVLFSPIAHEDLHSPNLPDGAANNARLKLYSEAMAEVAQAKGVTFVDLFTPTLAAYPQAKTPWTTNGIHLTEQGNAQLAQIIDQALFGKPERGPDAAAREKLRQAVLDKNFHWFHRYRTTDGYSTYGDRAFLRFVGGQTNYEVLQRELQVLDVMTANRDQRIWAVAQGKDLEVDDRNTPPFIPVETNKPGPLPGGKHLFLSGEEAISKMQVHPQMQVNLYADEQMFPELINPVQMAWDTRGRLWVAVWPTYPHWKPKVERMNDKLLVLEDTDGDGRADKCSTFADGLHNPTGFEFWNGGVLVAMAPDLLFIKDTDGDGQADYRERVLHGLDTADTHHTSNSFTLDPGGALYFQEGTFHHSQVETPYGPPVRLANAGVFRFEPRTRKFEVYVTYPFANPHGHVFDRWGQDFVTDGTGNEHYHGTAFSGHREFPHKHRNLRRMLDNKGRRPCPGTELLSSRHFPDDVQGNYLIGDVINFMGIMHYRIRDEGSGFYGEETDPILRSTDPNFRPSDFEIGPDGALYFTDWQNPIIGHMQHNLRDPSRDKIHGRVYRVTYKGRPLLEPAKIAGEPIEKLLDLLKEPENRVRYRVRIELSGRPSAEVVAATQKWIEGLDKTDPEYEHHVLEGLWVHQHHNVVNEELLKRVLRSPDFRARAAATRVLCGWRDQVSNPLSLLEVQVQDEHPRVRLEAIRALSFFHGEQAQAAEEIAIQALERPGDDYIDYTLRETLDALEEQGGT